MAQAPIMPLFTDAIIGDTTHLSAEQFGAYLLILIATWRNNGQPLFDDDSCMARICRSTISRWRKQLRPLLVRFFTVDEAGWHQKRLEKEWEKLSKFRAKQARNSMLAVKAKALKNNNTNEPSGSPTGQPNGNLSLSLSLSLEESKEKENKQKTEKADVPAVAQEGQKGTGADAPVRSFEFEKWWEEYPCKVGKEHARKKFAKARTKASLDELVSGVRRYVTAKPEDRLWMNPANWLKQCRWQDGENFGNVIRFPESSGPERDLTDDEVRRILGTG